MTEAFPRPVPAGNATPSLIERVAARLSQQVDPARSDPKPAAVASLPPSCPRDAFVDNPYGEIRPEKLRQGRFIVPGAAASGLSEAYRITKRHLLSHAFGSQEVAAVERGRAIVVSSAFPNEGKTFCSINIALSLAGEKDVEVVLVDGDTVKPEVLSLLGLGGSGGLMDALVAGEPPERYLIQTSIPNLSVLPAGRRAHDDIELLASRSMHEFVDRMLAEKLQRILLFDSAPVLSASSGPAMAAFAGQILMVVRADRTREEQLADAVRLFRGHKGLQFLLNRTTFSPPGETYGYYYGYGS